jgi:glycosyltransferase involved in cell wall biosynthesis
VLSISVVTPSLNQGQFIERTIQSILGQDAANYSLEYIVVDGGSGDTTLEVVQRYAPRLRWVSEPDRGQADAVNKGIRSTAGDVIGWLNSDDVYRPGALALVAEVFVAQPAVDVLYGDAQLVDADDGPLGAYYTEPWNPARLVERCFLCQPAVFFRRRLVERFGVLDERLHYCMDYEYWLRLAAGGATFSYLPRVLAASRLHPATKTLSAGLVMHEEINTMLRARLGRVPDSWLINHAHTLVAVSRTDGGRPRTPYALDVIVHAIRLSWRWNRAISGGLLTGLMKPVLARAKRRSLLTLARGS